MYRADKVFEMIPGMISRMRHDYKFYLRYNGLKGGLMSTEYVLLAV